MREAEVKVRVLQEEPQHAVVHELRGDLALDDGPAADHAHGRMVLRDGGAAGPAGPAGEAADGDRALGHGVDAAVGAEERGLEEDAALEGLGIAQRGDGDVDPRAGLEEGPDVGRHHDGRRVLGGEILDVLRDAVALEEVDDAVQHRDRVAVALPRQAGHEPVADQLVVPAALDQGDVLDPRGARRDGARAQAEDEEGDDRPVAAELHGGGILSGEWAPA
jgi:hypothetical protein